MELNVTDIFRSLTVLTIFFISINLWCQTNELKPNIIFILVDDQGYGDIGVFHQNERSNKGLPFQRTPNLDMMAEEGAIFTNHYSSSSVCAPSRASLLSGLSQGHANVRDNQFDKAIEDNHNMASTLKTLGYRTAAIGKWGLQGDNRWDERGEEWLGKPTNRGFDYFLGYMRHSDGHEHYPKEGVYMGAKEVWLNDEMITDKLDKSYTTDLWTAGAKKWIVDHHNDKCKDGPFFLYLAYDTPHAVLELPTQEYPSGGGVEGGIQYIGEKGNFINTASDKVDSYIYPEYDTATYDNHNLSTLNVEWPETYKRYATVNRRIDDAVGDILKLLKDLGIDKNTLVVYSSDNGVSNESYLGEWQKEEENALPTFFESYGPFDGIKRDSWEGGIRVPTIARWPGKIKEGKRIDVPSVQYDWPVTFLELAGSHAPIRMDGISLTASMLKDIEVKDSRSVYLEYFSDSKTPNYTDFLEERKGQYRGHTQNIRIGNYMGVRYNIKDSNDDFQIYDVEKDPSQREDLLKIDDGIVIEDRELVLGINQPTIGDLNQWMKKRTLQVRIPRPDIVRPYDKALVPSINVSVTQGLDWEFYKGEFPWIPQMEKLHPEQEGGTDTLQINEPIADNANGVLLFKGFIEVPKDGKYTFYMESTNSAFVSLHKINLLDGDFGENSGLQTTIRLQAGFHPIAVYYKIDKELESHQIKLFWEGPGMIKNELTKFYKKN